MTVSTGPVTACWFVAQYQAALVNTAKFFLDRAGFRYDDPFITEPATGRSSRLFPGYLLVQFDLETSRWQEINRLPGIVKLLPKNREEPTALPPGFVDAVNARLTEGENAVESLISRYTTGDVVEIVDGPFVGHNARIVGVGPRGRTYMLEVILFKRAMQIEALPRQVGVAA